LFGLENEKLEADHYMSSDPAYLTYPPLFMSTHNIEQSASIFVKIFFQPNRNLLA